MKIVVSAIGPIGGSKEFSSPGPFVMGRAEEADFLISDLRVSRHHATLHLGAEGWVVQDTSHSGTFDESGKSIAWVQIDRELILHLGAPDGPAVTITPLDTRRLTGIDDSDRVPVQRVAEESRPPVPDPAKSDVLLIGRAEDCDLVLDGLVVSRHHARLETIDGEPWIVDLASSNGTYVSGKRVDRARIHEGSRVVVGHHNLSFEEGALRPVPPEGHDALLARMLTVVADDDTVIVEDVSLEARRGSFTAVVGPTGAGKSTLLKALTGEWAPYSGTVLVEGRDLYRNYDELRLQLGYVPQDDIVHHELTAAQALEFGAELRLPDETTEAERKAKIAQVGHALGLTEHLDKRVSRLSGGQRKRVSVALELLTEPPLLFLDEPTSGLDPAYEQAIMQLLREISDQGRTVFVVTHSIASLDLCDQVVFLGTGGWVAYAGPPDQALASFGARDYPEVFRALDSPNPMPTQLSTQPATTESTASEAAHPASTRTQVATLTRRNLAVLLSDRRNLLILTIAAVVPAVLLAALVGSDSLAPDSDQASTGGRTLLGGIVITAGVIGAANGLREIVKEKVIYQRERAAGLRRSAYLASKLLVLGSVSALQAVLVVLVATYGAGGPESGNLLPGRLELMLDASLTAVVALVGGLLISAIVSTSEKALALIPVVFVAMWLFSGTVSDLADKPVLRDIAYLSPSNWGMAASASTSDLLELEQCGRTGTDDTNQAQPDEPRGGHAREGDQRVADDGSTVEVEPLCDARWVHTTPTWLWDLAVLMALGGIAYTGTDVALARREPLPHLRRQHALNGLASWTRSILDHRWCPASEVARVIGRDGS